MARYALINPGNVLHRLAGDVDPNVQTKPGWKWLPCDPVAPPSFDPLTEIVEGPTYTIGASSVTEVWTKRNLTAQEISTRKNAAIAGLNGPWSPILKALYDLDKRLRVLEVAPEITFPQFKNNLPDVL